MVEISLEPNSQIIEPKSPFWDVLKKILADILYEFECEDRECSILYCDNKFIHRLNKEYRSKDLPTDVLSFAFDDADDEFHLESKALGDIIVSMEMAVEQATEFEVSYEEELARLSIHGLLHLLGFDHERSEEDHKEMFEIQDEFMSLFMKEYNDSESSHI